MILFTVLFLLWVILNGKITLEICLFGIGFSLLLTLFSRKFLGYGEEKKHHSALWYLLLIKYLATVFVEIIKSNAGVLRIAFAHRLNFQPTLVYFQPDLKEEGSRVLLANSITITPGTITVIMDDGRFCVHCLDKSLAAGIDQSVFVKQLKRMEEV